MKRKNWAVGDYAIRPMGKPDRCFYCNAKIGEQHKWGCVLREKTVVLELKMNIVIDVPEHWNEDAVNFYFNESSWCADNIIDKLEERSEYRCLCDVANFKYLRDATKEDEETWGVAKVDEIKC